MPSRSPSAFANRCLRMWVGCALALLLGAASARPFAALGFACGARFGSPARGGDGFERAASTKSSSSGSISAKSRGGFA
eukprot:2052442-Prymnesium_polylepis.1